MPPYRLTKLGWSAALFLALSPAAFAASTINSLPPVQPFPLVDPGNPQGAVENLWITTGNGPGGDWRITPTQLGYIFQGSVAPTSPFRYQYWWNTGAAPPELEIFDGAQWVTAGMLNPSAHTWQINNGNLALGNYPNITGVGTLTQGVWNATIIAPAFGGTGVNNGTFTATLGGNLLTAGSLTTAGAFPLTLTTTALTNSTFPAGTHNLAPLDSPSFITPNIGVATGTSLALGGATIGSNAFAVNGTTSLSGDVAVIGATTLTGATTAAGNLTVSSGKLILSGNESATAWTTSGIRYTSVSGTLTDTSSGGTVAAAYSNVLAGDTIAASNPTTFTAYYNQYVGTPIAGGNVTFTNVYALGTDSLRVNGKITSSGGAVDFMLDGVGLEASTGGIKMPKSNAGGTCSGNTGTIINYGAANGAPAGGSYTYWDCSVNGGTFGWVDGGVGVGLLSTTGMSIVPVAAANGYIAQPQSGTGAGGFALLGTWNVGLDLSGGTYATTAINLAATAAGSKIEYDASNFTDLSGSAGSGVYRVHAGGNLAATFAATLTQLGSTVAQHLGSGQTTPPVLSACGTSPDDTGATDTAGTVTMGTGTPTGCVITFNQAYVAAPHCTVTWQGTPLAAQSYAVSNTAITLTQTATDSNKVDYVCVAQAGG